MTSELKPCPFCGSGYIDTGCLTVGCCRCGANGPEGYEGVTETWNTRPIEDALRAEVEALKAANFNIAVCGAHATSQEPAGCVLCEVARLQAELEKRDAPLTDYREAYHDKALLRDALHHWGMPSQLAMVAEEAAELAVAAMHMLRDQHLNKSGAPDDFCSEMADVEIMIDQMKVAGYADKIAEFKASKMLRLGTRLDAAIREVRGK